MTKPTEAKSAAPHAGKSHKGEPSRIPPGVTLTNSTSPGLAKPASGPGDKGDKP